MRDFDCKPLHLDADKDDVASIARINPDHIYHSLESVRNDIQDIAAIGNALWDIHCAAKKGQDVGATAAHNQTEQPRTDRSNEIQSAYNGAYQAVTAAAEKMIANGEVKERGAA